MGTSDPINSNAHIYLGLNALKLHGNENESWWYDEAHECIISMKSVHPSNEFITLQFEWLSNSKQNELIQNSVGKFPTTMPFIDVKLSIDLLFIAIQRSTTEIEIFSTKTNERHYNIMCKRANNILGLFWSAKEKGTMAKHPSQYLVLITTGGIELFKVTPFKCKFHRLLAYSIHMYWFHPLTNLLVLCTGVRGTELRPYFLDGGALTKCSKIVVSALVSRSDVFLAQLYKISYIIYHTGTQLLLYRIHPSLETMCVRALQGGFIDQISFSVVDHLLVIHSISYEVSCFYDIALTDTNEPFLHPLPPQLGGSYRYLSPNYAIRSITFDKISYVHSLHMHMAAIAKCANVGSRSYLQLTKLLLRRADATAAKNAFFVSLLDRLQDQMKLNDFSTIAQFLSQTYARVAVKLKQVDEENIRASNHILVLSQRTWLYQLWTIAKETLPPANATAYMLVYIQSLQLYRIPIDPEVFVIFIQLAVKANRWRDVLALGITDSLQVAQELEIHRHIDSAINQLATDMYHRLGAVDDLVRLLMEDGNVTMALRLALRYASANQLSLITHSPAWFFNAVVDVASSQHHGNNAKPIQLLYSLYVFLSTYNPTYMSRDESNCSQLADECSFPDHLFFDEIDRWKYKTLFGFTTSTPTYDSNRM